MWCCARSALATTTGISHLQGLCHTLLPFPLGDLDPAQVKEALQDIIRADAAALGRGAVEEA